MTETPSTGITFAHEQDLPRVPLPTLEESASRFLEWCAPLLTDAERATTEHAVAEFLRPDSPARILHGALARHAADPDTVSWLDRFWADRYLGRRDRIALNANFYFLFEPSPLGQVDRAANLVAAALDVKARVDGETLEPATQKGAPLAMDQFRHLFSSTRIPGERIDSSRTPYSDAWPGPSTERHIVVFARGHAFALDVLDEHGTARPVADIAAGLAAVREAGTSAPERGPSVGHLTTQARADWARSRARLLARDASNVAALDELERGLFCVALEAGTPAGPREAGDALLAGDSANRWFDKSVTLIVFADGTAGFNGEHCNLDGTTIVAFLDHLLAAETAPTESGEHADRGTAPRHAAIAFDLDDDLAAEVRAAGEAFAAYAADMASTVRSLDFSSERAKKLGVSPDAFAQLSFQLAHRRAKGFVGATYEAIATRSFRHGRTEAMRVVTPAIVALADAMEDPAADDATRATAARAAIDAHVDRARACQAGQAPEQHLWELLLTQQREGEQLKATAPMALYESPGWRVMRDDHLSTSAVPSPHIRYWGFGSTSMHCIGVGYAIMPGRFDLYLSTPRPVADEMATFADELPRAVAELEALLGA